MKLFKKNKKTEEQDVAAAILNPETLAVNPEPSKSDELEKIIKTTDSMNIVSALEGQEVIQNKKSKHDLANVREAIYRSFDLARRKIATEYEQIIVSGNYVDNAYHAVQITVKNFEKKWNVEYVESIIKKFTDALPEQLSLGRTIMITKDIVIEPIIYVDKVLPSWKITPDFALLTNALKWEDVVNHLIEEGDLAQDSKEIIAELVDAISHNVKNGYYVKLSRFIIVQIYPGSAQKIVLFSNDTLKKMNDIYARFLKTGERKQINKYDTVAHYEKTEKAIENEFLSQDAKEIIEEDTFVPTDLKVEITDELVEELKEQKSVETVDKEIQTLEDAKEIKFEIEETKPDKAPKTKKVISKIIVAKSESISETKAKPVKKSTSASVKNKKTSSNAGNKSSSVKKVITKTTQNSKTVTKNKVKKGEESRDINLVANALSELVANALSEKTKTAPKPITKKATPKKTSKK